MICNGCKSKIHYSHLRGPTCLDAHLATAKHNNIPKIRRNKKKKIQDVEMDALKKENSELKLDIKKLKIELELKNEENKKLTSLMEQMNQIKNEFNEIQIDFKVE